VQIGEIWASIDSHRDGSARARENAVGTRPAKGEEPERNLHKQRISPLQVQRSWKKGRYLRISKDILKTQGAKIQVKKSNQPGDRKNDASPPESLKIKDIDRKKIRGRREEEH